MALYGIMVWLKKISVWKFCRVNQQPWQLLLINCCSLGVATICLLCSMNVRSTRQTGSAHFPPVLRLSCVLNSPCTSNGCSISYRYPDPNSRNTGWECTTVKTEILHAIICLNVFGFKMLFEVVVFSGCIIYKTTSNQKRDTVSYIADPPLYLQIRQALI
jgi:hypothetical protein